MAIVTYTLTSEPLTQIRLQIKTCTVLDMARYYKLLREVNAWVLERTGKSVDQWTPEDWRIFDDDDTAPMFGIGQDRAAMLAVLGTVETLNGDGEWHPGQLPAEWEGLEGFATRMPPPLYTAWLGAAQRCNPGVFSVSGTDDEKKSGYVSVNW